ncbi:response regulator transcription factor [Polyangium aurulentum]|uniref:response regulator transcription factor n=1 Tax=Polyangium aurulentum TaxID=2567896 RepID=UPI0010ADC696|nr:response regulator [Polyangium aurulentum]UQA61090.1 response regulator [Polyangium aurulentum]
MPSDFVVVVDADLSAYGALVEGLPADTYDVVSVATARAGFNASCALEPHVIITALNLPDADAIELAGVIRGHDTRVAYTPLIVLAATNDESTRLAVLKSGADLVMTAPVDPVELVAQVNAMIAMAERIREIERGQSILPPASDGQAYAVLGDPAKMSVASVLGALEIEQRSGELRFGGSSTRRLSIRIASGVLVSGMLDGQAVTALEALKAGLVWDGNQFGFVASAHEAPPSGSKQLGALLVAALAEAEPNERLAHEIIASSRLLGHPGGSLRMGDSTAFFFGEAAPSLRNDTAGLNSAASIKLGEPASMRLEDTAAGRRFLRDTAAGIRLGKLGESTASIRPTSIKLGDTSAGIKLTDTLVARKVGPSSYKGAPALTGTLASFGQPLPPRPPPPPAVSAPPAKEEEAVPESERTTMRRTLRGLDAPAVKPPGSGRS